MLASPDLRFLSGDLHRLEFLARSKMPVSKFKRRPRRFFGTPNLLGREARSPPHCQEAGRSEETPQEMPIPAETAKSKKLAISRGFRASSGPFGDEASTSQLLVSLKLLILSFLRR